MSNYEYIISSLPFLSADYKYREGEGFKDVVEEIRRDLSPSDSQTVDFLLEGFSDKLDADFYARALVHKNAYIREYFRFDLNLRNAKVRYLNGRLGRDSGTDVIDGKGDLWDEGLDIDLYRFQGGEFEEAAAVDAALSRLDLLDRERELDDIQWAKADTLSHFHYFDLTAVLCYLTKLHIVDRWLSLDPESGRERFRKLVEEVRGTFRGVEYKA